MESKKMKLDELIDATQKIVRAHRNKNEQLQLEITKEDQKEIEELSKLANVQIIADPDKSYDLFYNGIQKFLLSVLPKDTTIRNAILELKNILLTGKEKSNISSGKRGADSRMSTIADMEFVIDIISKWSRTPYDYMRLATLLLDKNKELKYVPEGRVIEDYL